MSIIGGFIVIADPVCNFVFGVPSDIIGLVDSENLKTTGESLFLSCIEKVSIYGGGYTRPHVP